MMALVQSELGSFNSLALRSQDDAYTLAYYLLGDDALASSATQAAFASLYRQGHVSHNHFRMNVLRKVLEICCVEIRAHPRAAAGNDLSSHLLDLCFEFRSAVVLVDVLNLSYAEAEQVSGCSEKELAKRLGHARLALGQLETLR